jgi:hypothetical protein
MDNLTLEMALDLLEQHLLLVLAYLLQMVQVQLLLPLLVAVVQHQSA